MKSQHVEYLKYSVATKDRPEGYVSYPGIVLTDPDADGRIQLMFLHPERHKHLSGADWRDAVDRAVDVLPEGKQGEGISFYRTLSGPPVTETKEYSDGSSATGPGPLPDQSPEQQAASDGKPSVADLDADAEEKEAKDATGGKPVLLNGKKARPVATGK